MGGKNILSLPFVHILDDAEASMQIRGTLSPAVEPTKGSQNTIKEREGRGRHLSRKADLNDKEI